MHKRRTSGLALGLIVLAVSAAWTLIPRDARSAQPQVKTSLEIRLIRQGNELLVSVMGTSATGPAYIGCSFYPRNVRNAATEGRHVVEQVNTTFGRVFKVPRNLEGGTFEVALWRSKIPTAQCKIPGDPWCKRNGFHMEGMLSYRSGQLNAGGTR